MVEPYNAVLSGTALVKEADAVVMWDNESLYDICRRQLAIENPSFSNINRIIAQAISAITAPVRFDGSLNSSLNQMVVNMVPYRKIHMLTTSYAPFVSLDSAYKKSTTTMDITNAALTKSNTMINCNISLGQLIACSLLYRGDVVPQEINDALVNVKRKKTIDFVDWCPGLKAGLTLQPNAVPKEDFAPTPRSICALLNTTQIVPKLMSQVNKCELMYRYRTFVFWYLGEGMEEGEYTESMEDLIYWKQEYDVFKV